MTPKAESEEVASGEQRNPETPGFPGRDVPHLRRSAFLSTRHPALTRWANVWRALRRWMKRRFCFSSQRLRAGLTYAAPTALDETQILLLIPALTRWANVCRAYGAG